MSVRANRLPVDVIASLPGWRLKEPMPASLCSFPAVCTEAAGGPGVETGQQNPPQSGPALADKVVTQPRG